MSRSLAKRLEAALANNALLERLTVSAAPVIERRSGDAAAARLEGPVLSGLARVLATQPEMSGFLSFRPALLERIAESGPDTLASRARELATGADIDTNRAAAPGDLEGNLDALRVLRREETCLAACLDLGGLVPFERVSDFLSVLAETITRRALDLAQISAPAPDSGFAVLAMGKLAGREFTYHSDLDLIFLYQGGVDRIDAASRLGQRLISYLTTMTGAGVAYPVDTRLRPSGQQGTLVTSFESFEHYEVETAEIWEHVALLRGRAIAGALETGQAVLASARSQVLAHPRRAWKYLAELRERVVAERASVSPEQVDFKTGAGGLMDVDFLAGGALLERGPGAFPAYPSVAAMLRAASPGPGVDRLLADQRLLRIVEARTRWVGGRPLETLDLRSDMLPAVAELVERGQSGPDLLERIAATRRRIRAAYAAVVESDSIHALDP